MKIEIHFFSCPSHILSAQVSGWAIGQYGTRTFLSLPIVLLAEARNKPSKQRQLPFGWVLTQFCFPDNAEPSPQKKKRKNQ